MIIKGCLQYTLGNDTLLISMAIHKNVNKAGATGGLKGHLFDYELGNDLKISKYTLYTVI